MSIRASFDGGRGLNYLKPHIAIDCFVGELELEPQSQGFTPANRSGYLPY